MVLPIFTFSTFINIHASSFDDGNTLTLTILKNNSNLHFKVNDISGIWSKDETIFAKIDGYAEDYHIANGRNESDGKLLAAKIDSNSPLYNILQNFNFLNKNINGLYRVAENKQTEAENITDNLTLNESVFILGTGSDNKSFGNGSALWVGNKGINFNSNLFILSTVFEDDANAICDNNGDININNSDDGDNIVFLGFNKIVNGAVLSAKNITANVNTFVMLGNEVDSTMGSILRSNNNGGISIVSGEDDGFLYIGDNKTGSSKDGYLFFSAKTLTLSSKNIYFNNNTDFRSIMAIVTGDVTIGDYNDINSKSIHFSNNTAGSNTGYLIQANGGNVTLTSEDIYFENNKNLYAAIGIGFYDLRITTTNSLVFKNNMGNTRANMIHAYSNVSLTSKNITLTGNQQFNNLISASANVTMEASDSITFTNNNGIDTATETALVKSFGILKFSTPNLSIDNIDNYDNILRNVARNIDASLEVKVSTLKLGNNIKLKEGLFYYSNNNITYTEATSRLGFNEIIFSETEEINYYIAKVINGITNDSLILGKVNPLGGNVREALFIYGGSGENNNTLEINITSNFSPEITSGADFKFIDRKEVNFIINSGATFNSSRIIVDRSDGNGRTNIKFIGNNTNSSRVRLKHIQRGENGSDGGGADASNNENGDNKNAADLSFSNLSLFLAEGASIDVSHIKFDKVKITTEINMAPTLEIFHMMGNDVKIEGLNIPVDFVIRNGNGVSSAKVKFFSNSDAVPENMFYLASGNDKYNISYDGNGIFIINSNGYENNIPIEERILRELGNSNKNIGNQFDTMDSSLSSEEEKQLARDNIKTIAEVLNLDRVDIKNDIVKSNEETSMLGIQTSIAMQISKQIYAENVDYLCYSDYYDNYYNNYYDDDYYDDYESNYGKNSRKKKTTTITRKASPTYRAWIEYGFSYMGTLGKNNNSSGDSISSLDHLITIGGDMITGGGKINVGMLFMLTMGNINEPLNHRDHITPFLSLYLSGVVAKISSAVDMILRTNLTYGHGFNRNRNVGTANKNLLDRYGKTFSQGNDNVSVDMIAEMDSNLWGLGMGLRYNFFHANSHSNDLGMEYGSINNNRLAVMLTARLSPLSNSKFYIIANGGYYVLDRSSREMILTINGDSHYNIPVVNGASRWFFAGGLGGDYGIQNVMVRGLNLILGFKAMVTLEQHMLGGVAMFRFGLRW